MTPFQKRLSLVLGSALVTVLAQLFPEYSAVIATLAHLAGMLTGVAIQGPTENPTVVLAVPSVPPAPLDPLAPEASK